MLSGASANTTLVGRKRGRATRERVRQLHALDADEFTGRGDHLNYSSSYYIERVAGPLAAWAALAAMSSDRAPIVGMWHYDDDGTTDAGGGGGGGGGGGKPVPSLLLFNKMYGVDLDMAYRNDEGRETLHTFSAIYSRAEARILRPEDWLFEPLYGGETDRGEDADEPRFIPRPALFDGATQSIMAKATSDFGWRSLIYVNTGANDPWPTGIVALEAFLFKAVEYTHVSQTGKPVKAVRSVDETEMSVYDARVSALLEAVPTLVEGYEAQRVLRTIGGVTTSDDGQVADDVVRDSLRRQMDRNIASDKAADDADMRDVDDDDDDENEEEDAPASQANNAVNRAQDSARKRVSDASYEMLD